MKKLIIALLVMVSTQCMQKDALLKQEAIEITRETAWLTHVTRVFPKNGTIVAGALGQITAADLPQDFSAQEALLQRAVVGLSFIKNSVHWCVNSLVYPHEAQVEDTSKVKRTVLVIREEPPYCILEPMTAFNGKQLCGLWQDVFHLGSHILSSQSLLLVPAHDPSYSTLTGNFTGTVVPYEGPLLEAVEKIMCDKNIPVLYPANNGAKIHVFGNDTPDICIENQIISQASLSKSLQLDHTYYDFTSLSGLFNHLQQLLRGPRKFLLNEYLKNAFDCLEIAGTPLCAECKKSAQEMSIPHLLRCINCKNAYYCSAACQKKQWPSHKNRCAFLKDVNLTDGHHNYLHELELVQIAPQFFERHLFGKIQDYFKTIRKNYTQDRERLLLASYEQSILVLINHLYSQEKKYVTLRAFFKIDTLQGFGNYCHYVRKKAVEVGALPA